MCTEVFWEFPWGFLNEQRAQGSQMVLACRSSVYSPDDVIHELV